MSRLIEIADGFLNPHFWKYLLFCNFRLLLSVIFISALVALIVRRRRYVRLIDKLPGPKSNFLIGNILHLGLHSSVGRNHALQVMSHLLEGYEILYKKGIFRLWFVTSPMVFISNYKAMEAVAGSQTLTDKNSFYKLFEIGVKTGLVTSNGEKHKMRRKLINPVFHFSILQNFFPIFNKNSWIAVRKIHEKLEDGIIELNKIVTMYTLDSICETAMGITINAQNEGDRNYAKAIQALAALAVEQVSRPWLWFDFIFRRTEMGKEAYKHLNVFHNFSRNVIQERLKKLKNLKDISWNKNDELSTKKRYFFLDLLLEEHLKDEQFTLEDVGEEVDTFLVAGHDTSATGMLWTLYLIGLHPEIQKKIHAEIDDIFGDDMERDVIPADIKKLKYIECVFKEGIRLYPPASIIGRKITEDTNINGYLVPKDTDCWLNIYALHRDPEFFPEPEKFDPDRFLPENSEGRHLFVYMPFSAGPRNCIGQKFAMDEVKILLTNIFRHFRIESTQSRDKLVPSLTAILHPPGPILVKCCKRREDTI